MLLASPLPFHKHHYLLKMSCTSSRRPSWCSLGMNLKLYISRCIQKLYVSEPLNNLHQMVQQLELHCIYSWWADRRKEFHDLLFRYRRFCTKCHQFLACLSSSSITRQKSTLEWAINRLHSSYLWRLCISSRQNDWTAQNQQYHVNSTVVHFFQHPSIHTIQKKQ